MEWDREQVSILSNNIIGKDGNEMKLPKDFMQTELNHDWKSIEMKEMMPARHPRAGPRMVCRHWFLTNDEARPFEVRDGGANGVGS